MEDKTPSSLQKMLRKSLATFQSGMGSASGTTHGESCTADAAGAIWRPDDQHDEAMRSRILKAVEAHALDGEALLDAALAADAAGKRTSALLLYELSLAVRPDARAYNNIAVAHAEADAEDTALEWLERGLEHFPHDTTLLENYEALSQE